ncbi:MAG: sulfotransferase family protein [Brevefilum sp.]
MKFNLKLYLKTFWVSFFKSEGTPGRLTPKRFFILTLIFLLYPLYHFSIRLAYGLDQLFYSQHMDQEVEKPIFIVGNFRSGTTLLHRLLAKDPRFTGMKTWEIYVAPTITQRKFIRWLMKINRMIGNPIQKVINRFEKALAEYSYMHKARLNEIEEDSHVMLHIWSTYHLFAFFPFPELVRNFIYYDQEVSEDQKEIEMDYFQEILKRHLFTNKGKRFISKNPSFSPKVKTLHQKFPDAKFINLVRSPLRVIPSSVSMFSNHWQTYGEPDEEYPRPAAEVMREQAKHWYIYPHQYLKRLPPDQYGMVRYRDLVRDPKATIEHIYERFGIEMTDEYRQTLIEECEKAKKFKSKHKYSMQEMGLNQEAIEQEFDETMREYDLDPKPVPVRAR